ncbi:MAG: glycosyl transferase [bacterium (Candidatus Ratteibacteria) CG_4_10_14_3_um_filter_41_18]|uniref:Glycosyl transferase n=3 Tax=Candidatus Ratteibacteria TaxID=2979319 RepID=A0A2M7YG44_9BACT|nr:MAG: glycosyl transferase [bacterium (Candidatus Ratteibacteria) CG01_land_8_20_14_3_00_40_19]PIX76890.1 MAG: glycosyl transferase [bacterium (Candidatus Ratteibacteria) CG_4_10_14_3_um_filter_41_18]PJA61943.1 MAG: glycosyl transferase [bacterium (Candidatus Ratteibacteria) CG_4_9_14_3_um_filter_41_21]
MKLSVIMPVYNEEKTIAEIIRRVKAVNLKKEIIIVEDGSTDKTKEILKEIIKQNDSQNDSDNKITIINQRKRHGKGTAIRRALKEVTGDIVIIQDADLEYNPAEISKVIAPIMAKKSKVVYGSRVKGHGKPFSSLMGWIYYLGGFSLSLFVNLLYQAKITDEPTCYKAFSTEVLKNVQLNCQNFEFCPEVTAKVLKKGIKISEVPITYHPRSLREGKKIGLKDWFIAVWTLLKYRFYN